MATRYSLFLTSRGMATLMVLLHPGRPGRERLKATGLPPLWESDDTVRRAWLPGASLSRSVAFEQGRDADVADDGIPALHRKIQVGQQRVDSVTIECSRVCEQRESDEGGRAQASIEHLECDGGAV